MDNSKRKPDPLKDGDSSSTGERRRLGRIVHDERGNASVQWHDAPPDYERPVLQVEKDPGDALSLQSGDAYDPYSNSTSGKAKGLGNTTRTDLRKLSEWIKMMRELEEKKRSGGE